MITLKTLNEVVQNIINNIRDRLTDVDTKEGTFIRDVFIDPISDEIVGLNFDMKLLEYSQSILTATDEDLDRLASNYNVTRKSANKSNGKIRFYIKSIDSDFVIKSNTQICTPSTYINESKVFKTTNTKDIYYVSSKSEVDEFANKDLYNFIHASDLKLDSNGMYYIDVDAVSNENGTMYNVGANVITYQITNLDNNIYSFTNPIAFTGGTDNESDASLALRIKLALQGANIGTKYGYLSYVLTQDSVIDAKVVAAGDLDMIRDNKDGGKVDIYIKGQNYEDGNYSTTITNNNVYIDDYTYSDLDIQSAYKPISNISSISYYDLDNNAYGLYNADDFEYEITNNKFTKLDEYEDFYSDMVSYINVIYNEDLDNLILQVKVNNYNEIKNGSCRISFNDENNFIDLNDGVSTDNYVITFDTENNDIKYIDIKFNELNNDCLFNICFPIISNVDAFINFNIIDINLLNQEDKNINTMNYSCSFYKVKDYYSIDQHEETNNAIIDIVNEVLDNTIMATIEKDEDLSELQKHDCTSYGSISSSSSLVYNDNGINKPYCYTLYKNMDKKYYVANFQFGDTSQTIDNNLYINANILQNEVDKNYFNIKLNLNKFNTVKNGVCNLLINDINNYINFSSIYVNNKQCNYKTMLNFNILTLNIDFETLSKENILDIKFEINDIKLAPDILLELKDVEIFDTYNNNININAYNCHAYINNDDLIIDQHIEDVNYYIAKEYNIIKSLDEVNDMYYYVYDFNLDKKAYYRDILLTYSVLFGDEINSEIQYTLNKYLKEDTFNNFSDYIKSTDVKDNLLLQVDYMKSRLSNYKYSLDFGMESLLNKNVYTEPYIYIYCSNIERDTDNYMDIKIYISNNPNIYNISGTLQIDNSNKFFDLSSYISINPNTNEEINMLTDSDLSNMDIIDDIIYLPINAIFESNTDETSQCIYNIQLKINDNLNALSTDLRLNDILIKDIGNNLFNYNSYNSSVSILIDVDDNYSYNYEQFDKASEKLILFNLTEHIVNAECYKIDINFPIEIETIDEVSSEIIDANIYNIPITFIKKEENLYVRTYYMPDYQVLKKNDVLMGNSIKTNYRIKWFISPLEILNGNLPISINFQYNKLIHDLQSNIENVKCLTADVLVKEAEEYPIEIIMDVKFNESYNEDDVKDTIINSLTEYINNGSSMGGVLRRVDIVVLVQDLDGVDYLDSCCMELRRLHGEDNTVINLNDYQYFKLSNIIINSI